MDRVNHPPPEEEDYIDYRFISCNDDAEEHETSPGESALNMKELPVLEILSTKVEDTEQDSELKTDLVSTTFNLYSHPGDQVPDIILISAEGILFYVHRKQLLEASDAYWNDLLVSSTGVIYPSHLHVVEDSPTLNVVLHAIYRLSLMDYSPSLLTLKAAVQALTRYGIPLKSNMCPGMPLFDEMVVKIPTMALEIYIIAAENDLFDLACEASKHLLSLRISSISNEIALRLGSVYLCMLCNLLTERSYVLKRLVVQPPKQHVPTETCGSHAYHNLLFEWAKIVSTIIFTGSPGISPELLHASLKPLNFPHTCPACVQSIDCHVQDIVSRWSLTPNTVCVRPQDIHAALPPS